MLPNNNEEQIKFKLIVDAQESLEKGKLLQERVDAIKREMIQLQEQSNLTFRQISRGMKEAAEEAAKLQKPDPSKFMTADPTSGKMVMTPFGKEQLAQAEALYALAKKQLADYKKDLMSAQQQIAKEQREIHKNEINALRAKNQEQTKTLQEASQLTAAAVRDQATLEINAIREVEKARRTERINGARTDKERFEIARDEANKAKQAEIAAIQEVILARKQLAMSLEVRNVAPGESSNAAVNTARQRLEVAEQEAALAKKLAQDSNQQLRAVETANARMATSFLRLGNALKYAFMGGLAFGILSFFQQLPAAIMKATEAAVEFSKTQLALAVGLREMRRRSGEAPMFAEVITQIEDMTNRFDGLYSKMDFSEAYATTISKLGRLGASFEQVNQVVEASAVLAQLNEKSLKDTTSALATYLNSGVSQGLEATGVIVGRAADKLAAFEAGLKSATLDGIDPAAKALIRLQFIAKQIDPQLAELSERPDIIANSWDEANNRVKDSTIELGTVFSPFVIKFKQGWADLLEFLSKYVVPILQDAFVFILDRVGAFAGQTIYLFAMMSEQIKRLANGEDLIGFKEFWVGFGEAAEKGSKAATKSIENDFIKGSQDAIAAFADKDVEFLGPIIPTDGDSEEIKEFWSKLFQDINELIRDYNRDLVQAELDYKQELVDIDEEYAQKRLDIERDYQEKLQDLARKNQQEIADEYRKYQQRIQDTEREYNQKLQDANAEFRENEIDAEDEFQKKLKRLREDFLFDLEDAVRERDARQIMNLIRRYNMQRERLIEDFKDEKQEREDNYKDQLEEIKLWRQRRLEELAIEHTRRLEEIAIQYQREREEAARNREQELAETEEWRDEQRADALRAYEQELEDLKQHFADRMTEILTSLMDEKEIQTKYADEIAALIKKTFGPGGKIENDFKNFNKVVDESVAKATEAIDMINKLEESLKIPEESSTPESSVPESNNQLPDTKDKIETPEDRQLPDTTNNVPGTNGVSSIINSGVTNPSSMMSDSSGLRTPAATSVGSTGIGKIEVYLSEGLEAKITEQTMSELIDVIAQARK